MRCFLRGLDCLRGPHPARGAESGKSSTGGAVSLKEISPDSNKAFRAVWMSVGAAHAHPASRAFQVPIPTHLGEAAGRSSSKGKGNWKSESAVKTESDFCSTLYACYNLDYLASHHVQTPCVHPLRRAFNRWPVPVWRWHHPLHCRSCIHPYIHQPTRSTPFSLHFSL